MVSSVNIFSISSVSSIISRVRGWVETWMSKSRWLWDHVIGESGIRNLESGIVVRGLGRCIIRFGIVIRE
jgi:hypothetical protein